MLTVASSIFGATPNQFSWHIQKHTICEFYTAMISPDHVSTMISQHQTGRGTKTPKKQAAENLGGCNAKRKPMNGGGIIIVAFAARNRICHGLVREGVSGRIIIYTHTYVIDYRTFIRPASQWLPIPFVGR